METGIDWFGMICFLGFAIAFLGGFIWSMKVQDKEVEKELRNGKVFKDCGMWGRTHILEPLGTCILNNTEYLEVLVTDTYAKKCWRERRLLKDVICKFGTNEHFWISPKELSEFRKDKADEKFRLI